MNLPSHSLVSLGWTLIHFCWQAAAIACVYKVADLFLSRSPRIPNSSSRYLFALLALLGMLAAAAGTFVYEELRLQRLDPSSSRSVNGTLTVNLSEPSFTTATILTPAQRTTLHSNLQTVVLRAESLLPWLDALWMLGVFALSARTVGGWLLLQRLRSSATRQLPPELAARFARLARRMGVHGRVALRISTRIASPLAVGMVRSLILLPASALTTLTAEQLEAVLAHELAHIRRADYLWNILQTMIETLFFFHPAVWWIGNQLRQQRELCCDDIALASCDDPLTYATALLALEESRAQQHAEHLAHPTAKTGRPLALALDGHQSPFTLRSRIARILGEPMQTTPAPRTLAPFSIVGVCAALALFALPVPRILASLRPQVSNPAPRPTLPAAPAAPQLVWQPALPATPAAQIVWKPASPANALAPAAPQSAAPPLATPQMPPSPAPAPSPAPVSTPTPAPAPAPMPQTSSLGVEIFRALTRTAQNGSAQTLYIKDHTSYQSRSNTHPDVQIAMAQSTTVQATGSAAAAPPSDYITAMRAAGYNEDIDQYVAMKVQGITPDYARQMANIGFGKPSIGDLVALKIHGVTPDYVNQLKASGLKVDSLNDLVSYRIFKVTPEFIAGMKSAGFADLPAKKLVELRVQNITPDFARAARQQFPDINVNQLVQLRIFHIDDAFIARAKSLGLTPLTVNKLVQLRTSGLLDDQRVEN